MDFEKEYKSLVGRITKAHLYAQTDSTRAVLEDIYPSLSESEDERIRAVILKLVLGMRDEIFTTADKLVTKPKVLAWLKKQKEVDWEEELEKCKRNYLYFFDKYVKIKLKPAEWSEEEYGRLFDIEHYLDGTLQLNPDRKIACIDFLKSLRPSWKPSEEQMEALRVTIDFMPDTFKPRCTLITLQNGLEKLM